MAQAKPIGNRFRHAFSVPAKLRAPLAFASGMALGMTLLAASFYAPRLDVTFWLTPRDLPGDYVVAVSNPDVVPVKIADGKRALTDAPPRMVFSQIMLPAEVPPLEVAAGKTGLVPFASAPIDAGLARDNRPAIALMIDDLGVVPDRSAHALRLPTEVTLSFLPYGPVSRPLAQAAAAKGHEIFLHVPMEPRGQANPGPNALMTKDSDRQLRAKLDKQIADLADAAPLAGINNHMGSRATADRRVMDEVMRGAAERGLVFVDSITTRNSKARVAAATYDVPFIARDVFLDHGEGEDFLLAQLDELERQARTRGIAVAIAHPHSTSLEILDVWVRGLEAKGLRLVTIREAIDMQSRRSQLAMAQ
ncbi:divergent polysaccharide deacetylase family protein [Candidatus Phaeomarinobacter ectocarpi]|nr:divergent polysaccharide deacetylase family protein [Candidatus Phaeomarinobacter ectocarpi]